jgi:MFS family permease
MFRAALRDRGLLGQATSGLVAQLTQAAAGLGIILVVQAAGGSLALAGAAAAVFVIGAGAARPVQGYLIDRHGARPVLVWSAVLHVAGAAALVAFVELEGAQWPLLLLALPVGLGEPPVAQSMRVTWAEIAREEDRTAAYSLITLIQELAVLFGPLLLAAIVALASASAALLAVTALSGLGTFALALTLPGSSARAPRSRGRLPLRFAGVRAVLAVTALFGVSLGAVELAIPALTDERGEPAVSGLLLALMSVGGVGGAIVYGARRWRTGTATHLVVLLGLLTVGLAPLIPSPSYVLMVVPLLIAGAAINPVVTAGALLIEDHAPSAAAEVFGWQSTALATGAAAGSAVAGLVAGGEGPSAAFAVSALAAAAAFGVAALAWRRLGSLASSG